MWHVGMTRRAVLEPFEEAWEPDALGCIGSSVVCRSTSGRRVSGYAGFPPQRGEHAYLEHQRKRSMLAAAAPEMARLILALEYVEFDETGEWYCPSCGGWKASCTIRLRGPMFLGHASTCALDAALRSAGVR